MRLRALAIALIAGLLTAPVSAQPSQLFTHGVACGEPTSSDVVLWTRTASASTVVPELLDDSGSAARTLPPVSTTADSDFTVKTLADALEAGTTVRYRFRGPNGELSPIGTCHTAPAADQQMPFSFAFSGDADWKWRPYPVLNALNQESLDFFIFLGDTIYETTNLQGTKVVEDLEGYRAKYRENRQLPGGLEGAVPLQGLYASFGMFSVPDNHELGVSIEQPSAPRYTEG